MKQEASEIGGELLDMIKSHLTGGEEIRMSGFGK
jgi:nucleoid DNA-binding protein